MAVVYAWFDSYDCVGYVVTLHISPHTDCPYLQPTHLVVGGADLWIQEVGLLQRKFFFKLSLDPFLIGRGAVGPVAVVRPVAQQHDEENAHRLRSALMQGGRASLWRLVPPTDMKAEEVDEATPKMLTRISKWQNGWS